MSIIARRVLFAVAAGIGMAVTPAPVQAQAKVQVQTDRDVLLDTLLECAEISVQPARAACYDDNIRRFRVSLSDAQRPDQPSDGAKRSGAGSDATALSTNTASRRFGTTTPRQIASSRSEVASVKRAGPVMTAIATVTERTPGSYVVALDDGAVWEFLDHMPLSYRPPRKGSVVEIDQGVLGGYRMRFDRQQPVRVKRIR